MSIKAYTRTLKDTEQPRQIERRLLSQATARLASVTESFDGANKTERAKMLTQEVKEALWQNQQIWLALKSDLTLPSNSLPDELRAGLLSISLWVERQTKAVLGGSGQIAPLISVNRNIVAGLEARPSPATPVEA